MEKYRVWLAGAAAIFVLFAMFVLLKRPGAPSVREDEGGSSSTGASSDPYEPRAWDAPPPGALDGGRQRLDPAGHAALQRRIHEALWAASGQTPPPSAGGAVGAPAGVAELSREYIQERIRTDFKPMAIKCYEELLAREPDAGGRAVMEFSIVADEKLGAIVEDSALGDGGTLTDPRFSTCLRESMSGVVFEAPAKGGKTTVRYPLIFSPGDDDDAAAPSRAR